MGLLVFIIVVIIVVVEVNYSGIIVGVARNCGLYIYILFTGK